MTKTKICIRCKGKGLTGSHVVHLGVPGLCYACDGAGYLVWKDADTVCSEETAIWKRAQEEMIEKAGYLKQEIERVRSRGSVILVARYEQELEDLRGAYRKAIKKLEDLSTAKGRWASKYFG
ncbi:MAG: hypothetical protein ACK5SM_00615 [Sphingomonadales bacterium]|jgi:hypothetical protein